MTLRVGGDRPGNALTLQSQKHLAYACGQAAAAPENLLVKTRLNAPIKVGSPFNVEGRIRAEGNPRRTLRSIFSVRSFSINGQARVIAPPTITASGLKPTTRLDIPIPR